MPHAPRRAAAFVVALRWAAADNCGNHQCAFGKTHVQAPAAICCRDAVLCPGAPCSDALCCEAVTCADSLVPDFASAHVIPLSAAQLQTCQTMLDQPCFSDCAPGYFATGRPEVRCLNDGLFDILPCSTGTCGPNERVMLNTCQPCPAGMIAPSGAMAAGPDTACSSAECNQPWLGHAAAHVNPVDSMQCGTTVSAPCPLTCSPGYIPIAGGSPALACRETAPTVIEWVLQIRCQAAQCGSNERVLNHRCTVCPVGYGSDGMKDATSDDTACEPFWCLNDAKVDPLRVPHHATLVPQNIPKLLKSGEPLPAGALQPMPGYFCAGDQAAPSGFAVCPYQSAPVFHITGYTCTGLSCPALTATAGVQDALSLAHAHPVNSDVSACDEVPKAACVLRCDSGYTTGSSSAIPTLDCIDDDGDGYAEWRVSHQCEPVRCSRAFPFLPHHIEAPASTEACNEVGKASCALRCMTGWSYQSEDEKPYLTCVDEDEWRVTHPCTSMCSFAGQDHIAGVVPRSAASDLGTPDGFVPGTGIVTGLPTPQETTCSPRSGFLLKDNSTGILCDPPDNTVSVPRSDCTLERCCVATCGFYTCPVGFRLLENPNTRRCPDHRITSCSADICCEARRCSPVNAPVVAGAAVDCSAAMQHGEVCQISPLADFSCRGAVACDMASSEAGGYDVSARCGAGCDWANLTAAAACGGAACMNLVAAHSLHRRRGFIDQTPVEGGDFRGARIGGPQGPEVDAENVCAPGYSPSTETVWRCQAVGGTATLSAQLCAAAEPQQTCATLPLAADSLACDGGRCSNVVGPWAVVAWRDGGFRDGRAATAVLTDPGVVVRNGGASGEQLVGNPCGNGLEVDRDARVRCEAAGGAASVDRQLCAPAPPRCSIVDTSIACVGECLNLLPAYAARRLTKAGAFQHGAAATQRAFDGALAAATRSSATTTATGSVCANGWMLSAAAEFVCRAEGSSATLTGQLCVPSSGAMCNTYAVPAGGSGASAAWAGKVVHVPAGFGDRVAASDALFDGARGVPDRALLPAPVCGGGMELNRAAVFSCGSGGGAAALDGQLCTSAGSASGAPSAGTMGERLRAWAMKQARVAGVPVIGASSPACTSHPTRSRWLRCGTTLQGNVDGLPSGFAAEFAATMAAVLRVARSRVVGATFRDGSVVATFDVTCGTECSDAASPPGSGNDGDGDDDDSSSSCPWWCWLLIIIAIVLCLCLLIFLAMKSGKKKDTTQSNQYSSVQNTHSTTEVHNTQVYKETHVTDDKQAPLLVPSPDPLVHTDNTPDADPHYGGADAERGRDRTPDGVTPWRDGPPSAAARDGSAAREQAGSPGGRSVDSTQIEQLSHQIDRLERLLTPPSGTHHAGRAPVAQRSPGVPTLGDTRTLSPPKRRAASSSPNQPVMVTVAPSPYTGL